MPHDAAPADRESWDVIVIGAGPAGSLAARQLALAGSSVLLVDKAAFPRHKVCGCCLNASALHTLNSVGLGAIPIKLNAVPLDSLILAARGRRATLTTANGVALSRHALDNALIQAAIDAGASFQSSTVATVEQQHGDVERVTLRLNPIAGATTRVGSATRVVPSVPIESQLSEAFSRSFLPDTPAPRAAQCSGGWWHPQSVHPIPTHLPSTLSARCLIIADGLSGSSLANRPEFAVTHRPGSLIGAGAILDEHDTPRHYPRGSIFMSIGPHGYVGAVRLEDNRLNIAAALKSSFVQSCKGVGPALSQIIARAEMPDIPALRNTRFHGTPHLTRRRRTLHSPSIIVLGDAAGYVEPFTGEGMAWALASAVASLPYSLALARGEKSPAKSWTAAYSQLIAPRQRVCRAVSCILRHELLSAGLISALSHWPSLASSALRRVESPALRSASLAGAAR